MLNAVDNKPKLGAKIDTPPNVQTSIQGLKQIDRSGEKSSMQSIADFKGVKTPKDVALRLLMMQ